MATRPVQSEANILELYRISLHNAEAQPEIASALTQIGYTATKISYGKELLSKTRFAYDLNKTKHDNAMVASATFASLKAELTTQYRLHRKKAKIIFRNNNVAKSKLQLISPIPRTYIAWIETVTHFYTVSSSDTHIQAQLMQLAITPKQISEASKLILQVLAARSSYIKQAGEAQDATSIKNAAFATMNNHMSEFYAIARIALMQHPQLLEALGKKA